MHRLALTSLVVCSLALVGCGDDSKSSTDASTTDGDSDSTTSADASESDGTTGEPEPVLPVDVPARGGIVISWVEANQGIGVRIGEAGQGVAGADRTAYLPQGRTTLIRAFWEIPDDWKPRKIEARLTIEYADGTTVEQSQKQTVEGESFEGDLKRSFYFGLMADEVVPGIDYKIELYEVEAGFEEIPEGDVPPNAPYEGTAVVGIEDSYQVMRAVVVPFNITQGTSEQPDCISDLSTISDAAKQRYYDYMFMMNPVDSLEIEWHEAIDYPGVLQSFAQTNQYLANLRFEAGEHPDDPEVYYYGVADVCAGGIGGAGGLANGIPTQPIKSAAASRVSSGVLWEVSASGENDDALKINADTFVHEVGHSQGRRHVTCSGEEGGPDNAYPIPGGDIGEWGWGVIDFGLKHHTVYKDYMTYCNPAWVSTYGWNKVYPVIKTLSAWDFEDAPAQPQGDLYARYGGALLMGHINTDGSAEWSTVPGALDGTPPSAVHRVELAHADQEGGALSLPVIVDAQEDGGTMIWAELPEGVDPDTLDGASEIVWVDAVKDTRRAYSATQLNELRAAIRGREAAK